MAAEKGNTRKCRPNQGKELDYKTMNLGDIKELHKQFLVNNTAEKHNVFMWTIDKFYRKRKNLCES